MPIGANLAEFQAVFIAAVAALEKIRAQLQKTLADEASTDEIKYQCSQILPLISTSQGRLGAAYYIRADQYINTPVGKIELEKIQKAVALVEASISQQDTVPLVDTLHSLVASWEGLLGAQTPNPEPVPPTANTTKPSGAYSIWVADKDGKIIDPPSDPRNRDRHPDPFNPTATDIYFIVENPSSEIAKEQADLQGEIDKVLRAVQRLYLQAQVINQERFRIYYVRLFRIAQMGLEGDAAPAIAASALATVTADLIDDEAGRVKNGHLKALGAYALKYALPFAVFYAIIGWFPNGFIVLGLRALSCEPSVVSAFMLLWMGCFAGVWLAYGIRKTKISLTDLVTTDEDRLEPQIRLVFAGLLTMLLGMFLVLGAVDVTVGDISLTAIHKTPMLAFLIGAICGISELVLPASVGNRAANVFSSLK